MENSDHYDSVHQWGDKQIDLHTHDLPALKATYLIDKLPTHGRVLEIGCGGGRILNTIAAHLPHLDLYGCDIRPLRYTPSNFTFELVTPTDSEFPYPHGTFDAVIMFDFLEHVEDPAAVLAAAKKLLTPAGRLVSFTPMEGQRFSFYGLFRRILGRDLYVRTKEHIQIYSEKSLRRLVETDFAIVDHVYAYHVIGHLMDASLFAMLKSRRLASRFWQGNPFYEETVAESGGKGRSSILGAILRFANVIAYSESRLLHRVGFGAAGLLFVAEPRPENDQLGSRQTSRTQTAALDSSRPRIQRLASK